MQVNRAAHTLGILLAGLLEAERSARSPRAARRRGARVGAARVQRPRPARQPTGKPPPA